MENFFSWLLIFVGLLIMGSATRDRFIRFLFLMAAVLVTLYFGLSAVVVRPGI